MAIALGVTAWDGRRIAPTIAPISAKVPELINSSRDPSRRHKELGCIQHRLHGGLMTEVSAKGGLGSPAARGRRQRRNHGKGEASSARITRRFGVQPRSGSVAPRGTLAEAQSASREVGGLLARGTVGAERACRTRRPV